MYHQLKLIANPSVFVLNIADKETEIQLGR